MDEAFEQAIREQAEAKPEGESASTPPEDSTVASSITSLEDSLVTSGQNKVFGGNYPVDIRKKYHIMDDVLGKGSFGTVRKCRLLNSNQIFALKTINKSRLPDATQLRREVDILLDVDHPHIIKLYDVFEDETDIYLVSELCTGGELYDRVVEKSRSKEGHFNEFTAARIIRNILSAISYCHDVKNIVHRDLKPENFLLTDKTDNAQVKVIDFGLSRYAPLDRMNSQVGTIYYVAPEVLFADYTEKADIWSIGVVAYVLLCGFPPFNAGSESLTYNVVKEGNVKFPSPHWDNISPDAINFVKRLLDKDPENRPSAAEALQDPWVTHEHVNPFQKLWHGTFLSMFSPEAESTEGVSKIELADTENQKTFQRALVRQKSRRNIHHERHTGFTDSIRSYLRGEYDSEYMYAPKRSSTEA